MSSFESKCYHHRKQMAQNTKHKQLGMNASTASAILLKDILFRYIEKDNINCFRCNSPMTRENFSVDHKEPWLHSDNPKDLFFNLSNVSFSHLKCNIAAGRKRKEATHGGATYYKNKKCRCEECMTWYKNQPRPVYDSKKRREQYQRTGN